MSTCCLERRLLWTRSDWRVRGSKRWIGLLRDWERELVANVSLLPTRVWISCKNEMQIQLTLQAIVLFRARQSKGLYWENYIELLLIKAVKTKYVFTVLSTHRKPNGLHTSMYFSE